MTRLLLDAHLSGRVIGRALRERGHDVRALDAEKELEGLEDVLFLAVSENRVFVTAGVGDFFPLMTGLNDEGRSHAGCILIPNSFRTDDFGALILAIDGKLEGAREEEWIDRVAWAQRSSRRR